MSVYVVVEVNERPSRIQPEPFVIHRVFTLKEDAERYVSVRRFLGNFKIIQTTIDYDLEKKN